MIKWDALFQRRNLKLQQFSSYDEVVKFCKMVKVSPPTLDEYSKTVGPLVTIQTVELEYSILDNAETIEEESESESLLEEEESEELILEEESESIEETVLTEINWSKLSKTRKITIQELCDERNIEYTALHTKKNLISKLKEFHGE